MGKHHLSLNTDTDQYRCNLCGAHGNSVSLYARLKGMSNKEAYLELVEETKVYAMPQTPPPKHRSGSLLRCSSAMPRIRICWTI